MKLIKLLSLLTIMYLASSCAITKTMTAKRIDIYGSGVIQHPVVAELNVKKTKVIGTAKSSYGTTISSDTRNNAIADALKKANADVLIEPVFETETNKGVTTVTVTGFPGTYEGFRLATVEDVPLLDMGILQKATVAEPQAAQRKNKGLGIILATVAIVAGVLIVGGL